MIKWIVIAILGLIMLGAMGYDVRDAVKSPATQSNLQYAKEIVGAIWTKYLSKPAKFVWDNIIIKYVWEPVIKLLDEKIRGEDFRTMKLNTASTTSR